MKKNLSILALVLVLVSFAISVFAQTPTKVSGPQISFDKETHNYGTIYVNGDGNCAFTITNVGSEPLLLSSVRAGCGCTVPEWSQEPILPGKTGVIKVKYTTLSTPHKINKSVVVTSNSVEKSTVVLMLIGEVVEAPKDFSPEKTQNMNAAPTPK